MNKVRLLRGSYVLVDLLSVVKGTQKGRETTDLIKERLNEVSMFRSRQPHFSGAVFVRLFNDKKYEFFNQKTKNKIREVSFKDEIIGLIPVNTIENNPSYYVRSFPPESFIRIEIKDDFDCALISNSFNFYIFSLQEKKDY